MLFISCPDFSNRMHNFYVPLVIRLELKEGAEQVFFEEVSQTSNTKSLPSPPRQRRRLVSGMKKRSPPVDSAPPPTTTGKEQGKEHKHYGPTAANPNAARSEKEHSQSSIDQKGKRTYSEVVVETLEGDKLRPLIERNPAEQSQTRSRTPSSRAQSEPGGDSEYLSYYYGNPLLEKTEGLLHFYKYSDESLVAETQCRMLCMLAVPAHISTRDLITFIGPAIDQIERFRIVRDSTPNQYSVIIKFKKHYDAVVFYEEYNGMQFDNLDTHKCTLLYVDKIESLTSNQMADVREDDRLVELPTCACCLERLDDGVVSILCNHTFHAECLQKWSDITCPVCRYIQTPELVAEQRCSDCGQSSDLWICLICGNIGCGRYAEAHAQRHFEMTSHTFCLQVGGDRVWDYAGDNYVHRLIQSGEDGKLVEYNRGMDSIDGDKKNEELAMEYTCLLTSQLEDQRKYFESRIADVENSMNELEKTAQAKIEELEKQLTKTNRELKQQKEKNKEVETQKTALEKKNNQANEKINKMKTELADEKKMNELVLKDQKEWRTKMEAIEKKHKDMEKTLNDKVKDLESQVSDLMLHFEAQTKLEKEVANANVSQEEVHDSVFGLESSPHQPGHRRRSNKK